MNGKRHPGRLPPVASRHVIDACFGAGLLPPKIPESPTELVRAIVLLGARVAARNLTEKIRHELVALVGEYPSSEEEAAVWKAAFMKLRDWEKEEREEAARSTE